MNKKDIYKQAIERYKGRCALCGRPYEQLHHVYGGINRKKSTEYGMVVPLCRKCHEYVHAENYKGLKEKYQREFEETHTREQFREIFGKSYL